VVFGVAHLPVRFGKGELRTAKSFSWPEPRPNSDFLVSPHPWTRTPATEAPLVSRSSVLTYEAWPQRRNGALDPPASKQRHVAPQPSPPERVETPYLQHRATFKPQGTVRTMSPIPHPMRAPKGKYRRTSWWALSVGQLGRRGSHVRESSRKRAQTLIPCLPHLGRSATHSPDAAARYNRRACFCTASPRTTVGNAPPE